jgi:hypothetical protein
VYSDVLIRELVAHFARAASVTHSINVFTDPRAFERWRRRRGGLTKNDREHLLVGFALTFERTTKPHEIYFNPPRHVSLIELADSAAHEVAHLRWPHLSHGRLFDRRVQALLAGYRCGPKRERMPDSFR